MRTILAAMTILASVSSANAGYILAYSANFTHNYGSVAQVPFEYQSKGDCEKASIVIQEKGMDYICIPTDTHVHNKEAD